MPVCVGFSGAAMVGFVVILGLILTGSLISSVIDDIEDRGEDFASDQEQFVRDQIDRFGNSEIGQGLNDGVIRVGGAGDDLLIGGEGNDRLVGNLGNDTLQGGSGEDLLLGRGGNDLLSGEGGSDGLFGENGMDSLFGGGGSDLLNGGAGVDLLEGGDGNDTMVGDAGGDFMLGDSGNDLMDGGAESDQLFGGQGNDQLSGDTGADYLEGGADADTLRGGEGADEINGYLRVDGERIGTSGAVSYERVDVVDPDTLEGGEGADSLILGRGDTAFGGAGRDEFILGTWMAGPDASGVIADFEPAGEEILILVPRDYAGAGLVEVIPDGTDALLRMDGQIYARVTDAATTLTPDMVGVVFTARVSA